MKIIILTILIFISTNIFANTYYVAKNGNDTAPGTESQPWYTVQKAASTIIAGDTVFIKSGTYKERVEVHNSGTEDDYIVFINYQNDEVTIDGVDTTWWRWNGLFDISNKSYIEIAGLNIKNSYYAGIFVENSHHIVIKNVYTYNTYSSGIGVWESNNITVENNEVELACNDIEGVQECITIAISSYCTVRNNHIHHNGPGTNGGEGIDVKQGSHDVKVYGNLVHDLNQRIGIYTDAWKTHTYNIEIYNNEVHHCSNNGFNAQTEMGGVLEYVSIYNNISHHNKYDGIVVGSVTASDTVSKTPVKHIKIINNTSYQNGSSAYSGGWAWGILVNNPDAEDIVIRNNICSQNNSQIGIEQIKTGEQVDHNLIDGNNNAAHAVFGTDYVLGDPLFVDKASYDFHLQSNSPAIDKGSSVDAPEKDFDNNNRPFGNGIDIGSYEYVNIVLLQTKIFLEGSYNSNNGTMNTSLGNNIPLTSPYAEDARTVNSIPTDVVDWVLIQLRETANGNAVVSKSALLHKDGRIVADDGTTGEIEITAAERNYYIVIKHRNHLAVMSANTVALNGTSSTLYDFTNGSEKFYGTNGAKQLD